MEIEIEIEIEVEIEIELEPELELELRLELKLEIEILALPPGSWSHGSPAARDICPGPELMVPWFAHGMAWPMSWT